jgi:hypothetical protein
MLQVNDDEVEARQRGDLDRFGRRKLDERAYDPACPQSLTQQENV